MNARKIVMRILSISFTMLVILLVVLLLLKVGSKAYDLGYRVFTESPVDEGEGRDVVVQVKESMSASDMGDLLERKGLVRDGSLFAIQLKLSAYKDKIHSGVYYLNTSMTAEEMMQAMSVVSEPETQDSHREQVTESEVSTDTITPSTEGSDSEQTLE